MRVNWKRGVLAAAASALAVGVLGPAGTASAGVLLETGTDCPSQALSQPFRAWGDGASYTLVPNGGAEQGATGWKLTGSARVVSGNEPWYVSGRGSASVRIPSGSSATTPPLCISIEHPTVRLFAKRNSGLLSTLAVSAVLHLEGGGTLAVPVGVVLGGSWKPTPAYLYLGNLLSPLAGQSTPISFQFTPLLGGDWQVDDVYVDPFRSR